MVGASQNHQGLFAQFGHLPSPYIEAPETPSFLIGDKGVGCDIGVVKVTRREAGARDEDFTFTTDENISTKFAPVTKMLNYSMILSIAKNVFSFSSGPTSHIMGPGPENIHWFGVHSVVTFSFSGGHLFGCPGYKPLKPRLLHQVHMLQTQPAIRIRPRPLFEVPPADTERWKMEVLRMETRLIPTRCTCYVITIHLSNLICLSSEFWKESLHNIYSISHEVFTDQITPCHLDIPPAPHQWLGRTVRAPLLPCCPPGPPRAAPRSWRRPPLPWSRRGSRRNRWAEAEATSGRVVLNQLLVWGPVVWIPGIPLWKRLLLRVSYVKWL